MAPSAPSNPARSGSKPKRAQHAKHAKQVRKAAASAASSAASNADTGSQQEIASRELLKKLVCNDEESRDKAFKAVSSLVSTKRRLDDMQLRKLWKGLWYTMWHSDTPLVQQALARELAELALRVHEKNVVAFYRAFYAIAILEWGTLDRYRINKFYMLVRFMLSAQLARVAAQQWQPAAAAEFRDVMLDEPTGPLSFGNAKTSHSLRLHLIDIFVDELAKELEKSGCLPGSDSKSPATPEQLRAVLAPVLEQAQRSEFKHIKKRVQEDVLTDERLAEWGVVEQQPAVEEAVDSDWEGFDS